MNRPAISYEKAPWQVRIRRSLDAQPVGGGMLCPDGHVVTCAHVVTTGTGRPGGPVYVEFQNAAEHDPIPAVVVDGGWFPPSGEGGRRGDVAVLQLTAPAPESAAPAPLRPSPGNVDKTHSFHSYGYPKAHAGGGVPARGVIVGQAEFEWLSLLADRDGQGLDPGFSGSPVWDVELRGVIGIVVLRDIPRSSGDRGGTTGPRNAYAISTEALGGYWPALQPKIVRNLPSGGESLEQLLEVGPSADGGLPTVAETSVYDMGVTRSKYVSAANPKPDYVPRARVDAQIQEFLDAGERFIVAVGDSKSGKSRSMAEMLHRLRPGARLIVPAASDPAALSKLAGRELPLDGDGGVLWLDEINRYLVPHGLDRRILRSFLDREPKIIIAGTITSKAYYDMTAARAPGASRDVRTTRDATAQFGQVLAQAKLVHVASKPSPQDLAAAQEMYPDEDFQERGIGEQMVAAKEVEGVYGAAREASPEGWAVLQAAIDWRRIGVPGPVSRQALQLLFPRYLLDVAPHVAPDDDLFSRGLQWATNPLVGTIALLTTVDPAPDRGSYRAFDYVLACADGQGTMEPVSIAASAWDVAIDTLDADELLVVTQAAMIRDETDIAIRAAEAARGDQEDPAATARATLFLGELRASAGETSTAITLFEEAAASGITDVVPNAQADLGAILSLPGGDPDRARALLESAIGADDPRVVAQAKLALGVMLMNQGDGSRARSLLEAAMAAREYLADGPFVGLSGQGAGVRAPLTRKQTRAVRQLVEAAPGTSPMADDRSRVLQAAAVRRAESVHLMAQASLGGLLVNEGDLTQARMLLDAAIDSKNPEVEPLARTNLGALLLRNGDIPAAEEQFELVVASGESSTTRLAKISFGCLLAMRGDTERGSAMLRSVADSDDAEQAPRALCLLAEVYLENDEPQTALSCLERAIDSDHRDWAPYARTTVGRIRAQDGDTDGARDLLESVIAAKHPNESARAADLLGDVLLNADDLAGAEDAYRRAIGMRHPWWSAVATVDLAGLRGQQGAPEESAELLRSLMETGDATAAPMAADVLGSLLRLHIGDIEGAKAAYQEAIGSGHPDWSAAARFDLADLLYVEDDPAGAEAQLMEIANGPNRLYAAKAWDLIGNLLAESGESGKAGEAYQRAIDADVPEWSAIARVDLARLILIDTDDADAAEPLLNAALETGTPEVAAASRLVLGMIALFRGNHERAEEEFWQAAETGPVRVAGPALMQLAKLALDNGELDEAAQILEHLMDGSYEDEDLESYAAAHLGVVRLRQGNTGAALTLLQRGAASGNPDTAAYAHLHWGTLLFELGDVETAGEILEAALKLGQPEVADSVRASLGIVRLAQGDLVAANTLLSAALDGADRQDEPKIRRYLGSVLARLGRPDEARAVLEPLAASADTEHRPAGLLLLGRLAVQCGDAAAAKRWLGSAIEAGDLEVEIDARLELGRMLAESGDLPGSRPVLTPLLGYGSGVRAQAESILGEVTAAETRVTPALPPPRPDTGADDIAAPGTPSGTTGAPSGTTGTPSGETREITASEQTPAEPERRLAPLPASLLSALADLAEIEGQLAEAGYWRSVRDTA